MLVFVERGEPEYPEKSLSEQGENQQQTQPTYDARSGNRTRATLVGGQRSHHYPTHAPLSPASALMIFSLCLNSDVTDHTTQVEEDPGVEKVHISFQLNSLFHAFPKPGNS